MMSEYGVYDKSLPLSPHTGSELQLIFRQLACFVKTSFVGDLKTPRVFALMCIVRCHVHPADESA